jgi:hypothetical protein
MRRFLLVAVLLGAVAPAGAAFALDLEFDDAWEKPQEQSGGAIRAPKDHLLEPHFGRPHDPRGIIVLEGAK